MIHGLSKEGWLSLLLHYEIYFVIHLSIDFRGEIIKVFKSGCYQCIHRDINT
jgi:hypothetical protein